MQGRWRFACDELLAVLAMPGNGASLIIMSPEDEKCSYSRVRSCILRKPNAAGSSLVSCEKDKTPFPRDARRPSQLPVSRSRFLCGLCHQQTKESHQHRRRGFCLGRCPASSSAQTGVYVGPKPNAKRDEEDVTLHNQDNDNSYIRASSFWMHEYAHPSFADNWIIRLGAEL